MRTEPSAKGKSASHDTFIFGTVSRVIVMIVACAVASGGLNVDASPSQFREYQIKAAFLYNFVKFVEWPAEAFGDDNAPIILGVLGEDPFGVALESVEGKIVRGRELVIRRFKGVQDLDFSHILFISSSERARLTQILENLTGSSVLTVGEMAQFAELGGIINFTVRKNEIRFEINVDAAQRAGLQISSQLLRLAKVVRG